MFTTLLIPALPFIVPPAHVPVTVVQELPAEDSFCLDYNGGTLLVYSTHCDNLRPPRPYDQRN